MGFRRIAQSVCLLLFLALLAGAGSIREADLFVRMDPALAGLTAVSARSWTWLFLPALIVFGTALFCGRIFCGYICPMGTTVDASDSIVARRCSKTSPPPHWLSRRLSRHLLVFLFASAAAGVSMVFWAAPLALVTRFYGLVLYPVAELLASQGLALFYPLASLLDIRSIMFAELDPARFATQFFVLGIFGLIFAAGLITPRFWCRYLCPAGAILELAATRPLIRRRVNDACNQCGLCAKNCPMGAIDPVHPEYTDHGACIACRTCQSVCPQEAVAFGCRPLAAAAEEKKNKSPEAGAAPPSPARRKFLLSAAAGAGTAALSLSSLRAVTGEEARGRVAAPRLIRPPGALPEAAFLASCVRCGECMAACPTNTLQPIWFAAGFAGMFSPAITPERKYCDPRCTVCGKVCPTGAIRALSAKERIWAKTGTAVIMRQKCLAWEHKKSCMVCDEVCPYDAVEFEKKPEFPYPVPHVKEERCAGCGYCEHYCPVTNEAAIVITPMNELRLESGSYRETGRIRGSKLSLRPPSESLKPRTYPRTYPKANGAAAPATDSGGMAPGFDKGYE